MTDFDISIYSRRISDILERTLARMKTVNFLTAVLRDTSYEKTYPQDLKDKLSEIRMKFYSQEKLVKEGDYNALSDILDFFEHNKEFKSAAEKCKLEPSSQCQAFIKCLTELRNSVMAHQEENILQERAREERLRVCRLKNEHAAKEIAALEKELVEKKSDFNASIIGKNLLINRHQSKIERTEKVTQEAIEWRVAECEATIAADQEASVKTLETLKTELQDCSHNYDNLLKENLEAEKLLRMQRSKIENQLASWMETFDRDMGEKQSEEEQLQADYEREKRRYDDIQKMLDEQEEEYDELMQEKAAYEQQLVEQKLFLFILNRSARRIQRAYRAYKLRKMAKKTKKGKKGKGKKK